MLSWLSRPECVRGCHGHAISLKYLFSFAVVYVQQPRADGLDMFYCFAILHDDSVSA